jgi:hypothetical protein
MSVEQLKLGDGLLLKSFVDHPADTVKLTYKSPPNGRYHLAVWLGTWAEGEPDVDARLNAIGWVYDPERARAYLQENRDAAG